MSDRLLVSTRKGLFTLERGKGWKITGRDFMASNANLVGFDRRTATAYVSLDHGHFGTKVHRSKNGGPWEEIAAPAYPEQPEGHVETPHPFSGKVTPWKLQKIWCFASGHASRPGEMWCGTIPGGLFKSEDGGTTWALNRPLWDRPERSKFWFGGGEDYAGIHSVSVDPRNADHVTVAVSCGGVLVSEDGGGSWETRCKGMIADYMPPDRKEDPNAQDPHCLVQSPSSPDTMWVQHHNGIFGTTDGGRQWTRYTDVKPSVFGFAVAVHPKDGKTAWFVPAVKDEHRIPAEGKVVVTRTRDGGKTFQTLSKGLPQEDAYDLVFRHALDVDETGERLAFGSTTGSLWVSENGGDTWTTLAEHLPPVYSVRFA